MTITIRNVHNDDLDAVLALNESVVPHVNSVGPDKMRWFAEIADYFRVAESDKAIVGMLVGYRPGSAYDSAFYQWFCEHYDDFAYIDRVAVSADARRGGIAGSLYADFQSTYEGKVPALACEVNLLPANPTSVAFHGRMGFEQVDKAVIKPGERIVSRLLKPLPARA